MKLSNALFVLIFIAIILVCCNNERNVLHKVNTNEELEGIWELKYAGWYYDGDTIIYPSSKLKYLKSRRINCNGFYSIITQDSIRDFIHAAHGKYNTIDSVYIESFELHKNPKMIRDSVIMYYRLENNYMIISNEDFVERWVRIE